MCGIVGMAGVIDIDDEKAMENLLILDCLRGLDSIGVANVTSTSNAATIFKRAMSPIDYLQMPQWKEMKRKINRCFIGHNRWATKGVVISENAHPFKHGSITGVHNGTLTHQYLLPDSKEFGVDSENIMYAINKLGIEATAVKLGGAYALVWWDEANCNLHFFRNAQRPLTYCLSEDEQTIYYASEPAMLTTALHRNGIKHKEIMNTATETLYTINIPNRSGGVKADKLVVERKKLEVYKPVVTNTQSYWRNQGTYNTGTSKHRRELPAKTGQNLSFKLTGTTSHVGCYKARGKTTDDNKWPVTLVFKDEAAFKDYHIDYTSLYTGDVTHVAWDFGHDSMSYHINTASVFYYADDCMDDDGVVVLDASGEPISREEYGYRFSKCWCCNRDLVYTATNEILDDEHVLCPDCANDPRALTLLND